MAIIKKKLTSADKAVEKLESFIFLVDTVKEYDHFRTNLAVPQNVKIEPS